MVTDRENPQKQRLIVLVPDFLVGNTRLAHAIHRMAISDRQDVFYLAIVENPDNWLSVSRAMATMKAATGGDQVNAFSSLAALPDWLDALRAMYCPGDILVCQQEQQIKHPLADQTTPLPVLLGSLFDAPVKTLSGYYPANATRLANWFYPLVYWVGFLIILAAFFDLEIRIDQAVQQGATRSVLLVLVFCAALAAQLLWNRIADRTL